MICRFILPLYANVSFFIPVSRVQEIDFVSNGKKIFLIEILTKYDQNPKNIQSVSRGNIRKMEKVKEIIKAQIPLLADKKIEEIEDQMIDPLKYKYRQPYLLLKI